MKKGQPVSSSPFTVIEFVGECPDCNGQWVKRLSSDESRGSGGKVPFYCPVDDINFLVEFEIY
jgi:hypothetical protein